MDFRAARNEATRLFIGDTEILGVGLSSQDGPLVMFMRAHSVGDETAVRQWADSRNITVEFRVTGQLVAG